MDWLNSKKPLTKKDLKGKIRPARFLDLLLHQLHAHPAGAEKAGEAVSQRTGRHRRPLRQVRHREGHARTSARPCCATRSSIPSSTTPTTRSGTTSASAAGRRLMLIDPEGKVLWRPQRRVQSRRPGTGYRQSCIAYYRGEGAARREAVPSRHRLQSPTSPLLFPGKSAGRRSGQPAVHHRQQPQPHRDRRPRWQAASTSSARAPSAEMTATSPKRRSTIRKGGPATRTRCTWPTPKTTCSARWT